MIRTGWYGAKEIFKQPNPILICRSITEAMQDCLNTNYCTPRRYMPLAPPYKELLLPYLSGKLTYAGYTELYNRLVLANLDPDKVVEELGEDPILICYEKPGHFCHRLLVAKWLNAAGYPVEEYVYTTPVPAAVQDEWIF